MIAPASTYAVSERLFADRIGGPSRWRLDILHVTVCMAVFLAAVALVNPVLEMGIIDDWCYALTARDVAWLGWLKYHGLGAPMVGPQAYWAALFINLFGFSFTVVRLSTVLLVLICIPVLYGMGREAGLRPAFASFAVVVCVFSPLFLPTAISFMTDVPALCFAIACLFAMMRAWTAETARLGAVWIAIGTLAGALAGCTRQTYWLLPLTCLPVIAYVRFRRREPALAACAGAALLATAIAMLGALRWFNAQPYVPKLHILLTHEPVRNPEVGLFHSLVEIVTTCSLVLIPVLVLYIGPSKRLHSRKIWIAGALLVAGGFVIYESSPHRWPPRLGNIVTEYGILNPGDVVLGKKPLVLLPATRLSLAALMFATVAAFLAVVLHKLRSRNLVRFRGCSLVPFVALTFPFAVMSTVILCALPSVTQGWLGGFFDRYLIQFLPILSIPILWLYQTYVQDRVPAEGWVVLLIFACYATATTHDEFALSRARLIAAEALTSNGIPRNQVMAGVEYDGWTELEAIGHVNDPRVVEPASAYRPIRICTGPPELQQWFRPFTPSLRQRYFVVTSHLNGLVDSPFAPVSYRTWLPPYRGEVLTLMLPDGGTIECY